MFYQCFTSVSEVFHQCFTNVLPVFQKWVLTLKHKEGLYGEYSDLSKMTNGVRQGAILSAIAYCFYCEELFSLLKSRRTGCLVLHNYHGIFRYSDDNWVLAPSLTSLQDMLNTCEEYAASHNLQ